MKETKVIFLFFLGMFKFTVVGAQGLETASLAEIKYSFCKQYFTAEYLVGQMAHSSCDLSLRARSTINIEKSVDSALGFLEIILERADLDTSDYFVLKEVLEGFKNMASSDKDFAGKDLEMIVKIILNLTDKRMIENKALFRVFEANPR